MTVYRAFFLTLSAILLGFLYVLFVEKLTALPAAFLQVLNTGPHGLFFRTVSGTLSYCSRISFLEKSAEERRLKTMPKPISVLFCMEDLCFGGTQRQTIELVRRLDRSRFFPSMLMLTGPTDLDEIPRKAAVPLFYLGRRRAVFPFFFLTMGAFLKKNRPDLIVPCTALPNIWARLWGKLLGIPVVGTCRGGGAPRRQHERFLWPLTAHMICNSKALAEVLTGLGVPSSRLSYIPNGVDTDFFRPQDPPLRSRSRVVLCVARLAGDKDHLTLFRAVLRLRSAFPDLKLRVVGDGPCERTLKAWAADHPSLPVEWVPATSDVRPYYASASIFALSSVREGQPNVLLEAMSCGLPVCATAVGGVPALVREGQTGLLAPAGDDEAFAAALASLLREPARAEAMGAAGRKYVLEQHSFSAMVEAHQALFQRLAPPCR